MIAPLNAGVDTTGVTIEDREIPGPTGAPPSPVRIYAPTPSAAADGLHPALLDIHGGGFVVGSIEMEHGAAVQVVRRVGAVVVVVEYRLAPEHPFPAGVEDCYAALTWMHDHAADLGIDPARIAVGGQSAGGGLTAATVLFARDRGGPPVCFQFLGIPELDHRLETTSMRTFVDTPLWNRPERRAQLGPLPRAPRHAPATARCPRTRRRRSRPTCRAPAGLRHHDGVRPAARRGHHLRAARSSRPGSPSSCTAFPAPSTAPASSTPPPCRGAATRSCSSRCAAASG